MISIRIIELDGITAEYLDTPAFLEQGGPSMVSTYRSLYGRTSGRFNDRTARQQYIAQHIGNGLHDEFEIGLSASRLSFVLDSDTALTLAQITALTQIRFSYEGRIYALVSIGSEHDLAMQYYGDSSPSATSGLRLNFEATQ